MKKKKIAIIGTTGVPACYGGFETLADKLVVQWRGKYDVTVYCSAPHYKGKEQPKTYAGARLRWLPFKANGWQSIPYDIWSILEAVFYADVLLVLGISGCIVLPFLRPFIRAKVVVNIDGLEWRRDKWGKFSKKFLQFSERFAVKYSDADVTDNAAIKRYTARHYRTLSHMVTYGGDHCSIPDNRSTLVLQYPFVSKAYAFGVCRIEPENNLHIILEGFRNSHIPLVMVGNWNNSEYGKNLRIKYAHLPNYHLLDPIYDQPVIDGLRAYCKVYLHGHSAGGTNPSLVEAMHLRVPIVAYDVIYNRETTQNKAMFFRNSKDLAGIIAKLNEEKMREIGQQMYEIAQKHYTWSFIADRYDMIFRLLFAGFQKRKTHSDLTEYMKDNAFQWGIAHLLNDLPQISEINTGDRS